MKKRTEVLGARKFDLLKLQEEKLLLFRRQKEVCCSQEQDKSWPGYRNKQCFLDNRPSWGEEMTRWQGSGAE